MEHGRFRGVGILQCIANRRQQRADFSRLQGLVLNLPASQVLAEALPFDELHHQAIKLLPAVRLLENLIVYRLDNGRVSSQTQALRGLNFGDESIDETIGEQVGCGNLDRNHLAAVDSIDSHGPIDAGHAAAADFMFDLVAAIDREAARQTGPGRPRRAGSIGRKVRKQTGTSSSGPRGHPGFRQHGSGLLHLAFGKEFARKMPADYARVDAPMAKNTGKVSVRPVRVVRRGSAHRPGRRVPPSWGRPSEMRTTPTSSGNR